jgi:GNAT superfamily N-acetyltransferase
MIRKLEFSEVDIVRNLAYEIWPIVYQNMISKEQITYMLSWMYNLEVLQNAHKSGDSFFIFTKENVPVGFIHLNPQHDVLKLQKIYILPEHQKTGIGKKFLDHATYVAQENTFSRISLQVNRENPAVNFYLNNGFSISKEEDFDIGNGFLMNDFIMEKPIIT